MLRKILEMLYPKTCIFCGEICKEGICPECRKKVGMIKEPRCKKCGKPIRYQEEEYCYDCSHKNFRYEQGRSLWLHREPVKQSVYDFKYKNRRIYGEVYAGEMVKEFGRLINLWGIDLIVPVPLHKKKLRKRGFNQAEILAKEIGRLTGIPVDTKLIIRKKYTAPQKQFGRTERIKNLTDVFAPAGRRLSAKNVLIIDDIYTTGSTIDSAAKILLRLGAEKTYFLTISIGQGF